MGDGPKEESLLLTPSEVVLLRATHLAPPRWSTEVVTAYFWRRVGRPRPTLLGPVDVARLERLLFAEALLANERAGLLALTEGAAGLRAEPRTAPVPWPAAALEATLLRGRSLRVAQLVADWRGGTPDPLAAIASAAVRRGVLRDGGARHGVALVATSAAEAALARSPPASPAETCRTDRPALWRSLMAAIEEGFLLPPATAPASPPVPEARTDAGVDRYGVPSGDMPDQAVTMAILLGAFAVLTAIVLARFAGFDPDPSPATVRGAWPFCFGAAAAAFVFATARPSWPDGPLPQRGGPGEEEALARRRYRRLARPRTRPPLPIRLLGAAAMGVLVFVLTALVTPVGIAVLASASGIVSWRGREWYRMQLLAPSAREVELAVARRSGELSAGPGGTAAEGSAPAAGAATGRRARRRLTPAELPPPAPAALARTDRRRRLAVAAIRRHGVALLLLVAGLAAIAGMLGWYGRVDPRLALVACAAWLLCLARVPGRLLRAIHLTRPEPWEVAPGMAGRWLRRLAAALPHAGEGTLPDAARALRRRLAEEPDFWRDETLDLAAPLGASPRVLAAAAVVLFLPLLFAGLLSGVPDLAVAGAAGLGLVAAHAWFLRRRGAGRTSPQPGPRLVLLRVFGSPSFDDLLEVVRPWLLCGPIAHLDGYDSVVRSPEVLEALAAGRLDEVLVKSPEDLARRLAALPALPDDNGRYRRQAFQCVDAVWRGAVRALLDRGDAVLMDLSGLGPTNMGCAYELGLLLDRVPLSRVLLLVDESTDLACLDLVLDRAERLIAADSPNRGDPAAWRLLRIGGLSARGADESHDEWLRRLDLRLAPLPLVHLMLDGAGEIPHALFPADRF
jgi:hypothetical protein